MARILKHGLARCAKKRALAPLRAAMSYIARKHRMALKAQQRRAARVYVITDMIVDDMSEQK